MAFSDQFIKILDALCEKIGVTIDWTANNITPYLQDLMQRFIKYETYTSLVWLVLGIAGVIFFLMLAHKEAKSEYGDSGFVTLFFAAAVICMMLPIKQTMDIIEVNTIPEKTIIRYVQSLNH